MNNMNIMNNMNNMNNIDMIQKVNNDPNLNFLADHIYQFMLKVGKGEKKVLTLICTEVDSVQEYVESVHQCVLVALYAFPPDIAFSYHVEIKVSDNNILLVSFSRNGRSRSRDHDHHDNDNDDHDNIRNAEIL